MNMDEQQLPPGWVEAKIDELLPPLADGKTMHQGWSPRCDGGPATSDEDWAVLKTTSIQDGEFQPQHNKKIPSHLPPRPRLEVKSGDLLITSAGPRIRCGVPCLVRQTRPRLMISGKMYRFRAPRELDSVYFESVLRSPLLQKAIDEIKTGIDESGLNLTHERFRDLTIPIPPLPEQRRIVAKIEALQERSGRAAKALEEVGPLLEQFRQSILAAAFSGRLTADWREKNPNVEPAHELLARIRTEHGGSRTRRGVPYNVPHPDDFDFPKLPETWHFTSVGDLLHLGALLDVKDGNHGANHPRSAEFTACGLPFITAAQVRNYLIDYEGAPKLGGEALGRLRVGFAGIDDVVLTHKGTVGRTAICTANCVLTPQTTYYRCRPICLIPRYLMFYLSSPVFRMQLTAVMSQTTRDFVPISEQYKLFVVVPPIEEQFEIARLLDLGNQSTNSIERLDQELHSSLTELNQSILAKGFRGELVPQDPNDEPASELLARIRREREVSGDSVQGSGRKKRAGGKGNASESARPAKRSKRSPKAASATTPDASADSSPEPARPQRRRRSSPSNIADASLVIRVIAEGGAVNIHADTSGPTVQFYTKSSGSDDLLAEFEGYDDLDDTESQPHESPRTPNLRDLMTPEMALLYPEDINPTYIPELRTWHTGATTQIPDHFDKDLILDAKQRWSEAFEASAPSTSPRQTRKAHNGRLFDA